MHPAPRSLSSQPRTTLGAVVSTPHRWINVAAQFTLLAGTIGLQGCYFGNVLDAETHAPVPTVRVTATGSCGGNGCTDAYTALRVTDMDGAYVFDAYGNVNGEDQIQVVGRPSSGADTVAFHFETHTGYEERTLYLKRDMSTYTTDAGDTYAFQNVPDVYLCKLGAIDTDHDGICDAAEKEYGTNPLLANSDGDAFTDAAEIFGLASGGVDMRSLGADPNHKDIFIYLDYYEAPNPAALEQVKEAFANAPLANPDGTTGINLHIIMGKKIASHWQVKTLDRHPWAQVDVIKNFYFPRNLARVAHYVLFAYEFGTEGNSGQARGVPAHDFLVTLGSWNPAWGTQLHQAGTLMHELGHALGLHHGGIETVNNKPNYLSVMNYNYQVVGLHRDGVDGVLDYSRFQIAGFSESSVSEVEGLSPLGLTEHTDLARYRMKPHYRIPGHAEPLLGNCDGPLDFNGDTVLQPYARPVDLNNNGTTNDSFNSSHNDWRFLRYRGSASAGGVIGDDTTPIPGVLEFRSTPDLADELTQY